MKEWIWWIQSNTYPCCYEWCIIWIDDGHEERVEWDIQDNENILIIDWVILIDDVCWGVQFWRNSVIYKHRLNIVIFISFDWWARMIWRIDEKWEKIWKVNRVFLIPLISVLFGVFDEMVVPVIVWVFPTDSHELEYPRDHMCMSDVKPPTACDCGWDKSVWGECDDYWTPIPLTV